MGELTKKMNMAYLVIPIHWWSLRDQHARYHEELEQRFNEHVNSYHCAIMQLQIQYGVIKWRPWQQNLTFKRSAGKNLIFWSSLLLLLIFHIT